MSLSDHIDASGRIQIRVTPRASRSRIVVENEQVKVYVTVAPEGGKANAAVCALIAKSLAITKSRVSVVNGHASRIKTLAVSP